MEKDLLRKHAELRLRERIDALGPEAATPKTIEATRDQLRVLLHEVQVYEAELEIQNHELREAQSALEASRDRYADLFDFSPVGYLILDGRGVIRQINLTGAAMLGRQRIELVGYPLIHFVAREDRRELLRYLRHCKQRGNAAVTAELRILVRDDGSLPVELYTAAKPGKEGGSEFRVSMVGIAERKAAEAELRRARDELECRVVERTAQLEAVNASLRAEIAERERLTEELRRSNEELAEADRHKDDFMAMLAHELRNPLAAIANAGAILKRQTHGKGEENMCARVSQIIERQTGHFRVMLDDLLDMARVTRGKIVLKRETVLLDEIFRQAVETHHDFIEAHRHRLSIAVSEAPVYLDADFTRCVQIVGNLLHNAAKFTPPGGSIELAARREGGAAVIQVRDNGAGIPAELLGRIFEPFAQEDRTLARSSGGLGIGLALVRRLAEMHGGRVEAVSDGPGRGSGFTVRLPTAEPPP
jgi:PAS domain S-box-containing protein